MIDQFRKIVDRGIARGDVRREQPADLLGEILAGNYTSILRTWRGRPSYKLVVRLKKAARLMGEFLAPPER